MGVLNSWDTLLMKSFRRTSIAPSSSAMRLKFSSSTMSSRTGTLVSSGSTRVVKSPPAIFQVAVLTLDTGFAMCRASLARRSPLTIMVRVQMTIPRISATVPVTGPW